MTGESRNDAGRMDVTAEGRNDSAVCRTDGGDMSQDVLAIQIRVAVFSRTRLCANAEIGVPRGRIAFLRHRPSPPCHSRTARHSCIRRKDGSCV